MGEAGPGHIFLSHNAQDKAEVEVLARQLLDRGLRPWLDKWEIAAGRSWQEALQEAIEQASAVLVCVGLHGLGRVQLPEVEAALDRAFQDSARMVIPVFLPGAQGLELPPFLKQRNWVDLRNGESAHRQLFAALGTGSLAPAPRGAEGSPFRGLEAFEERHARWFFGREIYLGRLLGALRERRLLALIGASGSGKSSLVRAGLVPAVRTGELDQSYAWVPLLLRPGARPLHELALRVANALSVSREVSALREGMLRDRGLLADELDREAVRAAHELRFLLVVDQFEEVFTLCEDKAARAAFIDALLHAASVQGGRTHVVWTLRADFMTQLLEHPGLAEPLDRSNLLLGPMSAAELRSVIRRPALIAGLELESGLEDLLVQGVAGEPGDLPLLQFALEELWQQREGSRMTLAAYRRMGGLKGAIARRADAELAVLDDPQRALVRRLFGRLVQLGEGTADTRRRLEVSELAASHPELAAPLESLIRARLLTAHESEVEVAHEALIREWATLREWIEADRELLRMQHELARAVELWQQSGEASDLWSGGRLARALELRSSGQLTLSAPEEAFLDAAAKEAEREADAEHERQQRELEAARSLARSQASAARRLRVGLVSAAVLLAAFAAAAYLARQAEQIADSARETAQSTIKDAIGVTQLMVESVDRDLRDLTGAADVRRKILESGAALLDRLDDGVDATTMAQLQRSRAAYYEEQAELARTADQTTKARTELESALRIRQELAQASPDDVEAQLAWASTQEALGRVLEQQSARVDARSAYEKALTLRQALVQKQPESAELARGLAGSHRLLGTLLGRDELAEESIREFRSAVQLRERLAQQAPADEPLQIELAQAYVTLGTALPDLAEGRKTLELARGIQERLTRQSADGPRAQRELLETYEALGGLGWKAGDLDGARRAYESSLAISRRLAAEDPSSGSRLASTLGDFGSLELFAGRFPAAREYLAESVRQLDALRAQNRASSDQSSLERSLRRFAEASQEIGQLAQAREATERALGVIRGLVDKDPSDSAARASLRDGYRQLGMIAQQQGKLAEARSAFGSALSGAEPLLAERAGEAAALEGVADVLQRTAGLDLAEGRLAEARSALQRSLQLLESIPARRRGDALSLPNWPAVQRALGLVAQAEGSAADAARHFELALGVVREALARQPGNTRARLDAALTQRQLAGALQAAGRGEEARAQTEQALAAYRSIAEGDPSCYQAQRGLAELHGDLGQLELALGHSAPARAAFEQAELMLQRLAQQSGESEELRSRLAATTRELGRAALVQGERGAARQRLEQARERFRELTQQDPQSSAMARELAVSHRLLGELARAEAKPADALAEQQRSLELTRELLAREPTDFESRRELVAGQLALATAQQAAGQARAAQLSREQAIATAEQNLQSSPSSAQAQADLAQARGPAPAN